MSHWSFDEFSDTTWSPGEVTSSTCATGCDTPWQWNDAAFSTWDPEPKSIDSGVTPSDRHRVLTEEALRTLSRIRSKAEELSTCSIDDRDLAKLQTRASFCWGEDGKHASSSSRLSISSSSDGSDRQVTAVTTWRISAARKTYSLVQQLNAHLLLPVLLVVPPTKCSTPAAKLLVSMLQNDADLRSYRLYICDNLVLTLQSLAVNDRALGNSPSYAKYLELILPEQHLGSFPNTGNTTDGGWRARNSANSSPVQTSQSRSGDQCFTNLSVADVPMFLQSLIPGVFGSELAMTEALDGVATSNRATITVPLGSKDCVCRFVISREAAVEAIQKWQMIRIDS